MDTSLPQVWLQLPHWRHCFHCSIIFNTLPSLNAHLLPSFKVQFRCHLPFDFPDMSSAPEMEGFSLTHATLTLPSRCNIFGNMFYLKTVFFPPQEQHLQMLTLLVSLSSVLHHAVYISLSRERRRVA